MIYDHQPVTEAFRLFHVMGGEQNRQPLALELGQLVPQELAALRIKAGGGLIKNKQFGLVDQGTGQHQAALETTGEDHDLVIGAILQGEEAEQFIGAPFCFAAGDGKIAGVTDQVVAHREIGIERVFLLTDADAALDLAQV